MGESERERGGEREDKEGLNNHQTKESLTLTRQEYKNGTVKHGSCYKELKKRENYLKTEGYRK